MAAVILDDLLCCPFVTLGVAVGAGIWSSVFGAKVGPWHTQTMVVSVVDLHVRASWHVTVNTLDRCHGMHMVIGGIESPQSVEKIIGRTLIVAANA